MDDENTGCIFRCTAVMEPGRILVLHQDQEQAIVPRSVFERRGGWFVHRKSGPRPISTQEIDTSAMICDDHGFHTAKHCGHGR